MRRVVIHVGTHKTGTSSLQQAMGADTTALLEEGVLVPMAGRGAEPQSGGHHEIVVELEKFPDDRQRQIETQRLLEELRASSAPDAIVSSENFSMHVPAAGLAAFGAMLRDAGRETASVLYVRDRAALLESIYAEWVKHGTTWTFDELLASIIERARTPDLRPSARPFVFAYAALADNLAIAFGDVSVRAYDARWSNAELLGDFAFATRVPSLGRIAVPDVRYNPRLDFAAIAERFARSRGDTDPVARIAAFGDAAFLRERFAVLEDNDITRLHDAFEDDDRLLRERFGVTVLPEAAGTTGPNPAREALRSLAR